MYALARSSSLPSGSENPPPSRAGPGWPLAPPSTCTISRSGGPAPVSGAKLARYFDPRERPGAPAPAVAQLALPASGRPGDAALALAALDDHLDAGIVA